MTDQENRYHAYLDEFGTRLASAGHADDKHRAGARGFSRGISARVRRSVIVGGVACVATVGVTVGVVGLPGGATVDPVAKASAALASAGQIVHMRLTSTPVVIEPDTTVPAPQTTEYWTASKPTRWRMAWTPSKGGAVSVDDHGPIKGRQELAYGDGATYLYFAERDTLRIITGFADNSSASRLPSLIPLDPQRDIQPMLQRGELHDTGELMADGRRVRRLQGERDFGPGDRDTTMRIIYDVDADTFEPVGGQIFMTETEGRGGRTVKTRVDFHIDLYERLLDNDANAHLLLPQTTPRTAVTTDTVQELQKQLARQRSAQPGPSGERNVP